MSLREYFTIVRSHWKLVGGIVAVAFLAGAAYCTFKPPKYESTASIYVSSVEPTDNPAQAYQGTLLSQQRVKTYGELAKTDQITQRVVRQLGLDETPSQLASRIDAVTPNDTVLLNISVSDGSPEGAAAIANAVSSSLTELIGQLERSPYPNSSPSASARIAQPAVVNDIPTSPNVPRVLLIALAVGIAIGVSGALLKNALDLSIKDSTELSEATGLPVLASVPYEPVADGASVLGEDFRVQTRIGESIRQLRTSLQFIDVDSTAKTLLLTSANPAEGKSTITAALASVLAQAGHRTLLIDADMRRPTIAKIFDLDSSLGLSSVLSGQVSFRNAVVHRVRGTSLDVLTAGTPPPNPSELLGSNKCAVLLNELRDQYDVVLLDSPPVAHLSDAASIAHLCSATIVVCRARKTAGNAISATIGSLKASGASVSGAVLSMTREKRSSYSYYAAYSESTRQAETGVRAGDEITQQTPLPSRPSPTRRRGPAPIVSSEQR